LSDRDVEELLAEGGVEVDHETISSMRDSAIDSHDEHHKTNLTAKTTRLLKPVDRDMSPRDENRRP
jgi:transposase-like protein